MVKGERLKTSYIMFRRFESYHPHKGLWRSQVAQRAFNDGLFGKKKKSTPTPRTKEGPNFLLLFRQKIPVGRGFESL